ncbi:MAG: pentapeptide repeat-containing protein [Anaerolineales bacterium]
MGWRFYLRWVVWYRITRPFDWAGRVLSRLFTVRRVAFILAVLGFALFYFYRVTMAQLLPNIITDLFGIALAVFILDAMYRLRSDAELKKVLIAKLGSKNNAVATEAIHELKARGWLADGSLVRAFLISANLDGNSFTGADLRRVSFSFASLKATSWFEANVQGAFFDGADLQNAHLSMHAVGPHFAEADLSGAMLYKANLRGAHVRDEQLSRARSLWGATMPDGRLYDGRFNLQEDIKLHLKFARNPNDADEWARFYGVPLDQYLEGQAWAHQRERASNPPVSA